MKFVENSKFYVILRDLDLLAPKVPVLDVSDSEIDEIEKIRRLVEEVDKDKPTLFTTT